jgi:hypothetical protein
MRKIALFAFNGDPMCFIHVLLNTIDMKEKGCEVRLVVEGALIPELAQEDNFLHGLYKKAKALGVIDGACKACSNKLGVMSAVQEQGIRLLDDMHGHPSMARYQEEGFEVITF